ncbi:hypothetical protein FB446DRAFT_708937 [Lentinula raphanica]|nr:hypothetical protein FB446DRAFT_708937 [Lentinula raphanica]
MPNVRFQEPIVGHPVEPEGTPLPPPSTQTSALIASYTPPVPACPNYAPAHSSMTEASASASTNTMVAPTNAIDNNIAANTKNANNLSACVNSSNVGLGNVSANTFTNNTLVNPSAGATPCTGVDDATISGNESSNNASTNGTLVNPSAGTTQGAGADATYAGNTSGNNTFVNPSAGNKTSTNDVLVNPSAGATQSASVDDDTNTGNTSGSNALTTSGKSHLSLREILAPSEIFKDAQRCPETLEHFYYSEVAQDLGGVPGVSRDRASAARAEKLNADLKEFHQAQDSMISKIAEDNEISVQRVKRLVYHTTQSSKKKKASDHNVLVFIKSQEVNTGRAKGSRESLKRLHELVKANNELQQMAEDPDEISHLREQYDKYQEEKKLKSIRISKTAQARMVASKINEFQENATFMAEAADVASFGLLVRGSFESTVTSSFWGHGPVDEFFRKTFNKGVQDILDLFQAYVCTAKKIRNAGWIFCLISQGLCEITGISNLTMSYSKYDKLIVIPYKVRLLGWPEDVPFSYPHKLHVEEIKTLFDSLMAAFEYRRYITELENNGKLDSQQRPLRSDARKSHKRRRGHDDDSDNDDDNNEHPHTSKKVKRAHTTKAGRKGHVEERAGKDSGRSKKAKGGEKTLKKTTKKTSKRVAMSNKGKDKEKEKGKRAAKGKKKSFIIDSDEEEAQSSDGSCGSSNNFNSDMSDIDD